MSSRGELKSSLRAKTKKKVASPANRDSPNIVSFKATDGESEELARRVQDPGGEETAPLTSDDQLRSKLEALASKIHHIEEENRELHSLMPEVQQLKAENAELVAKVELLEGQDLDENVFEQNDDDLESASVRKGMVRHILAKVDKHLKERVPLQEGNRTASSSSLHGDIPRIERERSWRVIRSPLPEEKSGPARLQRMATLRRMQIKDMEKLLRLEQDAFSFLVCYKWSSAPFLYAFTVVFGLQLSLVILLLGDQLDILSNDNPFAVPANIEADVRVAQVLSILIAVFSQDDIRTGIEGLIQGMPVRFKGSRDLYQMNSMQWYFAYFVRFIVGTSTLVGTFVLIVRSDNVFDLFLNFSGIEFISALDDVVFSLSLRGYAGYKIEKAANKIVEARFDLDGRKKRWYCLTKKKRQIISLITIMLSMFGAYAYFVYNQVVGTYLDEQIKVEFGDEVISYLGTYNGCYGKQLSQNYYTGRATYAKFGSDHNGNAKFGFCVSNTDELDFEGWTFYTGDEPCSGIISRSSSTKSFDILESGLQDWFTNDGQPLDYIRLLKVEDANVDESCLKGLEAATCTSLTVESSLDGFIDRVRNWNRNYKLLKDDNGTETSFFNHPVFIGETPDPGTGLEAVFYSGRRWILASTYELKEASEKRLGIAFPDMFSELDLIAVLENEAFDILQLDTGTFNFISEAVGLSADEGFPLGLRWYNSRYMEGDQVKFPFADISRPSDALFQCGQCDYGNGNQCLFEGICSADGTCQCQHDTSGKLCDIIPLGDGVCHERFNALEFQYDGGDCCGETCQGSFCGLSGPTTPFGFDLNDPDAVASARGGYHGFASCANPDMVPMRIQLIRDGLPESFCDIDALEIVCGSTTYLQTPFLSFGDRFDSTNNCAQSYNDTVYLPYGVECELTRSSPTNVLSDYSPTIYFDNITTPFTEGTATQATVSLFVPPRCLSDFFRKYTDFNVNGDSAESLAIAAFTTDGISEALCNEGEIFVEERYALTLLNSALALNGTDFDLHQCFGWGSPVVSIQCMDQFVTSLSLNEDSTTQDGTIPTELGFFSKLESLRLSSRNIVGQVPTELGTLSTLITLHLKGNSLWGTIPKELGNLPNLELLSVRDNEITGGIPTEILNITSLKSLSLGGNKLVGTIPTEIGYLTNLEVLLIQDNSFTGTLPSELFGLPNLISCYLGGNSFTAGDIPRGSVCLL